MDGSECLFKNHNQLHELRFVEGKTFKHMHLHKSKKLLPEEFPQND